MISLQLNIERSIRKFLVFLFVSTTASRVIVYGICLPAKSGVGGGIVAIVPGQMTISVWSPELDKNGNSLAGVKALELFTTKTGCSIF